MTPKELSKYIIAIRERRYTDAQTILDDAKEAASLRHCCICGKTGTKLKGGCEDCDHNGMEKAA